MFCKKCGTQLAEQDKFCRKCGTPITVEANTKFCRSCGMQLERNQLFCTRCGTRWDDHAYHNGNTVTGKPATIVDNQILKHYSNMYYAVGQSKVFNNKPCTIILKKDRLEIQKGSMLAYTIGGAIGGAIAGMVEGNIAASGGGKADVTIYFKDILQMTEGKYGMNNTILVSLHNGQVYTLLIGKYQQEILQLIRANMY